MNEDLFSGCHDVIIKTLISAEPTIVKEMNKVGARQKCCFEVYGFDIMFDKDMKPWVLEVNCLPSLSSSSVFDKQVKTMLICDTFSLIGIRGYDKQQVKNKNTSIQEPTFKMTMAIEDLEALGGCMRYE